MAKNAKLKTDKQNIANRQLEKSHESKEMEKTDLFFFKNFKL